MPCHGPSGSQRDTDALIDNQGSSERFSLIALPATVLASCILTVMGFVAERHGWNLQRMTTRVEKTMTSSGIRSITLLEVWLQLPATLDAEARAQLELSSKRHPPNSTAGESNHFSWVLQEGFRCRHDSNNKIKSPAVRRGSCWG